MRTGRYLTVLSIFLFGLVLPTAAQRTRKPAPRPTPTPSKQTVNPVVTAAKQQVANQLHNVNVFIDKMGPIAVVIEDTDREAKARRLKKEEIDANEANKKKIIAAIRGLREGLVSLETDFRTKPQLSQYLPRVQGISTLCAQSEDSAIAGRFVASKEPLRQVAIKLNEALAVLPGPLPAEGRSSLSETRQISSSQNQTRPVVNQPISAVKGDVSPGMTPSEVLASNWGAPDSKRVSTSPNGTTEVWSYRGNRTLYFFNGRVTRIVR